MTCQQGDLECLNQPVSITYHFITLVSHLSLPPNGRVLFTYKGPSWYENIDFDMKVLHAQAPSNVRRADSKFFRYEIMIKTATFLIYILYFFLDNKKIFMSIALYTHTAWINIKMKPVSVYWRH